MFTDRKLFPLAFLDGLLHRYRAHRRYRRTYKALVGLDVLTRADIGVSWLEIDAASRHAARTA